MKEIVLTVCHSVLLVPHQSVYSTYMYSKNFYF
jgi:hypothetical protein